MNPAYERPVFSYDASQKHYVAELFFGRRYIMGGPSDIIRGSLVGLYSILAGGYCNFHFAHRFELQARALAGCGWHLGHCGADLTAGMGLGFFLDENFKIKAFADYETVGLAPQKPWMHSFVLGWSSAWSF